MKNEIEQIIVNHIDRKISLGEATTQIMRLFTITRQSEHINNDLIINLKPVGVKPGISIVNCKKVVKKWNHLFYILECRGDNTWALIKYMRKDSHKIDFNLSISKNQAYYIISNLNLMSEDKVFKDSFTWFRKQDSFMLKEWRIAKYK